MFLSERRPTPAGDPTSETSARPPVEPDSATTRARVLFTAHTGWELHQLRHSAATFLGEQGIPLQLIMAKTRHKNPRTAMRYIKPGAQTVADVTELLQPPRRRG